MEAIEIPHENGTLTIVQTSPRSSQEGDGTVTIVQTSPRTLETSGGAAVQVTSLPAPSKKYFPTLIFVNIGFNV